MKVQKTVPSINHCKKSENIFFPVAEKFVSLSGESLFAGRRAAFIRFAGCNLHCQYCDTKWAIDFDCADEKMSDLNLVRWVESVEVNHLILTGGEPLLQQGLLALCRRLLKIKSLRIEIETNGSCHLQPFTTIKKHFTNRILITMDWKLPDSGMETYMITENLSLLSKNDVLKWVVSNRKDLERADELINLYHLDEKVNLYFSPVMGEISGEEIANFILEKRYRRARLQLQLHKLSCLK